MENQKTICDWAIRTFGYPSSPRAVFVKLHEEYLELQDCFRDGDGGTWPTENAIEECADIYIMLVQLCNVLGYDLHEHVDNKMEVNRSRQWNNFGDGTGKHM